MRPGQRTRPFLRLFVELRHYCEEAPGVFVGLFLAHAAHAEELLAAARLLHGHVLQRGVGEHDVGRHALLGGDLRAQGAQRGVQVRRGHGGGVVLATAALRHRLRLLAADVHLHRLATEEHVPGRGGQEQHQVFRLDHDIAQLQQAVDDEVQLALAHVAHQPVGGQAVEPALLHALVPAPAQHLDDELAANAVAQAVAHALDAGEHLLRLHGYVPGDEPAAAVSALAAALRVLLAEVAEDIAAQTRARAAVFGHGVEPVEVAAAQGLALGGAEAFVLAAVFYEELGRHNISGGVEQHALGLGAVPPGASGLLVIGLQALGHVVVHDVGDVGLVYAHAEGVGGHHDLGAVELEVLLAAAALGVGEPGVVLHGGKARAAEPGADLFHLRARGAVDYPAASAPAGEEIPQLRELVRRAAHVEEEVRPVKARDQHVRLVEAQQADDVLAHLGRGRGGEGRDDGTPGQGADAGRYLEVAGSEILAPVGDAVRLVHGDERDLGPAERIGKGGALQPLGRYVEQAVDIPAQAAEHLAVLLRAQAAVEAGGGDARAAQGVHLVLHQRDERGDHQRQPRQQHGRELIAQRLAPAGGHDAETVAPGEYVVHQPLLTRAEAAEAEVAAQDIQLVRHSTHHL